MRQCIARRAHTLEQPFFDCEQFFITILLHVVTLEEPKAWQMVRVCFKNRLKGQNGTGGIRSFFPVKLCECFERRDSVVRSFSVPHGLKSSLCDPRVLTCKKFDSVNGFRCDCVRGVVVPYLSAEVRGPCIFARVF